ncbi:MAG: adenosine deaminase [Vulcanimicrobiaceae bacterium]
MLAGEFVQTLPKVHLHCHLEGTLRAATFLELAAHHGVATRYRPDALEESPSLNSGALRQAQDDRGVADPENVYKFETFQEFLFTFAAVSRSLKDPEDYARLASEFARDASEQNVMYGEIFISPSVWQFFHPQIDVRTCVQAIRAAFDAERARSGSELRLIVDLTRNFGLESAMRTAALAVELADLGVIGIGLGGNEQRFPAVDFEEPFALARAHGLRCVAHAGEAAGAHSVRDAVEVLRAERIGHGVRALEDPAVVDLLAHRGVPLEICPTSNFLTGIAMRDQPHPLLALDAAGAIVTIDADDPTLFGTTITDEYAYVASLAGETVLARFVRNAIDVSFADESIKASMRERLRAATLELGHERRT